MSDWTNTGSSPPGPNTRPDKSLRRGTKPRTLSVQFGDGYTQRLRDGINVLNESWDLSFKNRSIVDIRLMKAFLETKAGVTSFTWTPPGEFDGTTKVFNSPYQANSGGKIQCTSTAHGLKNGTNIQIYGVTGVTNTNGNWVIEQAATNTFVLSGSVFSGSPTSAGTIAIPDIRVICEDWTNETLFVEGDYLTGFGTFNCTFKRVYE
jgi:phage-related protein